MITCRGKEEEEKVARLATLLNLDKSEVVRQAINAYYVRYQQEFAAFQWLEPQLEALPGSGHADISTRRKELLGDILAERAAARR